jgi:hypothetical protein
VLLVRTQDDEKVEWALLNFVSALGGPPYSEVRYEVTAHGYGFGPTLGEARHTWFGEEGYVFSVRPALLAWAFGVLETWFRFY